MSVFIVVTDHIDHNRTRQNEHIIFAGVYFDAVGIAPGEPPFRASRHYAPAAFEDILVIQEISFRFQVIRAWNIHDELALEEGEQLFLDHGGEIPFTIHFVLWAPGKK